MADDSKTLLDQLMTEWTEFKKTNDEAQKSLATKGSVDTLLTEKLNALDASIAEKQKALEKRVELVENVANRPGTAGRSVDPAAAEHREAFVSYVRKGVEGNLRELEKKAITVGSDPNGGYFLPVETEAGVDRLASKTVAMMRLATVRTIGAASYKKRIRLTGATYGWVGETETPSETTTPTYGVLEFAPGTIYAEPQVSQEALEDLEVDVEGEITDSIDEAFGDGIAAALVTGNGVNKPKGLLSYPTVANSSWEWGKIGYVASGKAGAWADTNPQDALITHVHALKPQYRNGASWLMNDLTLSTARKFKDTTGQYLWQPSLQAGVPSQLLGYPVETDDNMPDIGANSLSIAFGDFRRAYLVVRRRGIAVLRDPFTAKPFVKFYTTMRIGGGIQHFEPVKLMKFAAS
jgi:HK97 family phage major capsid protein